MHKRVLHLNVMSGEPKIGSCILHAATRMVCIACEKTDLSCCPTLATCCAQIPPLTVPYPTLIHVETHTHHPGSCIKLTWLRNLKENLQLTDENSIQRYVKCHIMLLIGTILFGDKSGASMHWKFLLLLRDFGSIGQALCRASHYDCKKIDGPLTFLLGWAWICLPYLAPVSREPHSNLVLALIYSGNSGTCMASKSKTRMKDGSSNGTSFANAFAMSVTSGAMMPSSNEIVKGITSNGFSHMNFISSYVCNKI
ncbi:hypothetical protein Ahy_A01g004193 [Arachis hypogaea]|uniref:Aminotransferase-like plant mobile domain-containing protein n=1 Tax=Arachis hypogaea TaxID=3818 RepID=A0A445EVI8_ARAHY|nr:hypothetical protein Ahy_A01g004193 [Arachis hypogaea]